MVEQDSSVRRALCAVLEDDGYLVLAMEEGSAALAVAPSFKADLALLDGGRPDMTGAEVACGLRQCLDLPIVFLTGADSIEDVRDGFKLGMDDYVIKPFDPEELSWRVRATLRRRGHVATRVWKCGDLVVDEGARSVTRAGAPVSLTATEFKMVSMLIRNSTRVVSKDLLRTQLNTPGGAGDHGVEVHISSLRQKLEVLGPRLVHTIRGSGYILQP